MICIKCKNPTNQMINGIPICYQCEKQQHLDTLIEREGSIETSRDFESWKGQDMSELFWYHLGIYQKSPNAKSFQILKCAYLWAVHDNHALANSFSHALEWIGVRDLSKEAKQWSS